MADAYKKDSITLPGAVAMGSTFFYLVMDMIIHFGVFRHLRAEIGARGWVLLTAIVLDAVVLAAFAAMKWQSNPLIVMIGIVGMALVFLFVRVFLARNPVGDGAHDDHQEMACASNDWKPQAEKQTKG